MEKGWAGWLVVQTIVVALKVLYVWLRYRSAG